MKFYFLERKVKQAHVKTHQPALRRLMNWIISG